MRGLFATIATGSLLMLNAANAIEIEKLVMPGEVIEGHAEFEAECSACHVAFDRSRQESLCGDCHQDVRADKQRGIGFHGLGPDAASQSCVACHSEHLGREAKIAAFDTSAFDHLFTDFELHGAHVDVDCEACHADFGRFRDAPGTCLACHRDDDVHEGSRGDDCASCHRESDWQEILFDHDSRTDFALLGAHRTVTCDACHTDGTVDVKLESTCIACHRDDDAHAGLLGTDCASCHDEVRWTRNRFRHDVFTEFALRGSHSELSCESCHFEPVTRNNPGTACIDCHRDDDPHEGQLGENCASCHGEQTWLLDIRFDHDFTMFPLLGRHRDVSCDDCHETQRFSDAPLACVDCHASEDVHNGVLGSDCASCHTPANWSAWRFDHLLATGFVLDGAHSDLVCSDCHTRAPDPQRPTPSRCIDCHRNDDVHAGQFGRDCSRCHTTRSFDEVIRQ